METRAPYAVIGFFVLAAIVAVFGFVYWLNNVGGIGERTTYRVRFEHSVAGMLNGAAVLFNGIRVGEVTNLQLGTDDPNEIIATISVAPATPIRADTQAGIEFQGLTGVAVVSLAGGTGSTPLVSQDGRPPLIKADPMAWQTMTQAARTVMQRLDTVITDNADNLRGTIASLNTFAQALARNSDRIDGIVAGLERMTGGGPAAAPPVSYDLTAPRDFPPATAKKRGTLVVPEPNALLAFDTQKLLIQPSASDDPSFARAQWSDNVPKMVQSKVVQAFENAGYIESVSRPVDGLESDYQLLLDIRSFRISTAGEPAAEVELGAKIMNKDGKIVASRSFRKVAPAQLTDAASAVKAFDKAFGAVVTELVTWAAGAI